MVWMMVGLAAGEVVEVYNHTDGRNALEMVCERIQLPEFPDLELESIEVPQSLDGDATVAFIDQGISCELSRKGLLYSRQTVEVLIGSSRRLVCTGGLSIPLTCEWRKRHQSRRWTVCRAEMRRRR